MEVADSRPKVAQAIQKDPNQGKRDITRQTEVGDIYGTTLGDDNDGTKTIQDDAGETIDGRQIWNN